MGEAAFRTAVGVLSAFDARHLENATCSFVLPEFGDSHHRRAGPLTSRYPEIVRQLNADCRPLHVTRYATQWNVGFWFLREAAEGRTYGGRVLEISGRSSIRRYLQRPHTTFTEARYPAVDVQTLDRAYAAGSFDMVIAESVLEHVPNPFLAVLQMRRVLRPGGHMLVLLPSTYPYHFGPFDFWRTSPDALKVFASPFRRVTMCGCHRSGGLAALLASPDSNS